jgi:hypothetical protein
VAEDWRVTVALDDETDSGRLTHALHAHEVDEDVQARLGTRVAVSSAGSNVFLYADSENAMREAARVASEVLASHSLHGAVQLDRWHHEEEEWVDASVPLPQTPAELQQEHERLEEDESAESAETGIAEWEVRIDLASHHDAIAMTAQLERDGLSKIVRRWKYLLVGTEDKDDADALALRLQTELPLGASVHVEPGSGMAWELMRGNPFAVFGGLSS